MYKKLLANWFFDGDRQSNNHVKKLKDSLYVYIHTGALFCFLVNENIFCDYYCLGLLLLFCFKCIIFVYNCFINSVYIFVEDIIITCIKFKAF